MKALDTNILIRIEINYIIFSLPSENGFDSLLLTGKDSSPHTLLLLKGYTLICIEIKPKLNPLIII